MKLGRMLLALAAVCGLALAGAAQAQATRTWVSGVGDDANPCSRTAPCKTFAGAISKTAVGGEINALDPGGFGAVTITKSITISSEFVGAASVLATGTTGVVVNVAGTSRVHLRGLSIEGSGYTATPTAPYGVRIISGDVTIENCVIRNFRGTPGAGVGIETISTSAPSRVLIINSTILGNKVGVRSNNYSPTPTTGVGGPVVIQDTTIDRNDTGIQLIGSKGILTMNRITVLGTASGSYGLDIDHLNGAKAQTYGNNAINSISPGATLTPMPDPLR